MNKWVWVGLAISLAVAAVLSPFASSWPDGLERVAEDLGFDELAIEAPAVSSPIPDYLVPGISSEGLATSLAGIIGTILVFGIALGLAKVVGERRG